VLIEAEMEERLALEAINKAKEIISKLVIPVVIKSAASSSKLETGLQLRHNQKESAS
jgi:hypothetical protein